MKATAIYFSPAGGTGKAISCLAKEMEKKGITAQLLDFTGDKDIFPSKNFKPLLEKVGKHDLLILGGPVYIDHLQYNVLELLQALPPAGGKWSDEAFVVASFGKVTPGVALAEATSILRQGGRRTIGALNIDAEHCNSRAFSKRISRGLPGAEIVQLCAKAAGDAVKILTEGQGEKRDLTSLLQRQYDDFPNLRPEKDVLFNDFPAPVVDYENCIECLNCVENCPVRCIMEQDGKPFVTDIRLCIHCANCLVSCPADAIKMDISHKEEFLLKQLRSQGIAPDGPSRSCYYSAFEQS